VDRHHQVSQLSDLVRGIPVPALAALVHLQAPVEQVAHHQVVVAVGVLRVVARWPLAVRLVEAIRRRRLVVD
jgi:hypothetical protein